MTDRASGAGQTAVPPLAAGLGAAGLIPFWAGALGLWVLGGEHALPLASAMLAYGVVIASFMGAVHWGLAIAGDAGASSRSFSGAAGWQLGLSVVPALIAWAGAILPLDPPAVMVVHALLFAAIYGGDRAFAARGRTPGWYPRLRLPLTVAVVLAYAVALAAWLLRV